MTQRNFSNKKRIKKIGEKHHLSLVLSFGSFAKGKVHKRSDLDIAVLTKENLSFEEYSKLYSDFSEVFERQNVDLVLINHADPLFLKQILENCQLLYGTKRTLDELKIYSFKKYCDYRQYLDLERKFAHQFIKELNG